MANNTNNDSVTDDYTSSTASLPDPNSSTTSANTNANSNPDLSSKEFSVDKPSIPVTSVPAPAPIVEHNLPSSVSSSSSSSSSGGGGSDIPFGAIGSIAGTVVGGPIGGAIGSFLGNLFTEGGPVGMASGGVPHSPKDPVALTLGYLTGALHQQKYGGTPDTLGTAASEVKAHLAKSGNTPGFAAGGSADYSDAYGTTTGTTDPYTGNTDTASTSTSNLATDNKSVDQLILMRALGMLPDAGDAQGVTSEDHSKSNSTGANSSLSSNTANAMTSGAYGSNDTSSTSSDTSNASSNGYLQPLGSTKKSTTGYAAGGDAQGQPPLAPGQQFQGDGSVKGPGGPQDDAIPARLSNGEFVFSEPAVQFFGVDKLNKMNEQGKQGFMQALQQVQQNQPQGGPQQPPGSPQAAQMPPQAIMAQPPAQQMPPQPPMGQAQGGPSLSFRKGSGYAGL